MLSASSFVKGSGPIYLSELGCDGSNNSLLECPRGLLSPAGLAPDCDHSQDAGVLCHGKNINTRKCIYNNNAGSFS